MNIVLSPQGLYQLGVSVNVFKHFCLLTVMEGRANRRHRTEISAKISTDITAAVFLQTNSPKGVQGCVVESILILYQCSMETAQMLTRSGCGGWSILPKIAGIAAEPLSWTYMSAGAGAELPASWNPPSKWTVCLSPPLRQNAVERHSWSPTSFQRP